MVSRHLYQALGFAFGFVLIDYGFNLISNGLPGARAFTSQFLAVNFLLGGSVLVFVSLYYLLKPAAAPTTPTVVPKPIGVRPDVGMEIIVEEETPPKIGFYKTIEYIAYFFTVLGLISAVDLVLQVLIRSTYNEARWWVEVLLVTFGVLSYTIFGSVGRLGRQEEAELAKGTVTLNQKGSSVQTEIPPPARPAVTTEELPPLTVTISEFTRNSAGEYEKHLSAESYDMFRVDREMVAIWREDRRGMRSVYLAGPYELTKKMLQDCLVSGGGLSVGSLVLSNDSVRGLLGLMEKSTETVVTNV